MALKLNLAIATFNYGGNGGIPSTVPDAIEWLRAIYPGMRDDPRIGTITDLSYCDTPITMLRNRSVIEARQAKADLLLMIDSDIRPDAEIARDIRDPEAKPFWGTSFDFVYNNWEKGPHVVGAPYCGPPPEENIYCFRWQNNETDDPNDSDFRLEQYDRHTAETMRGIQPVAALPTGLILYDMRAFKLTEPQARDYGGEEVHSVQGYPLKKTGEGWFYYEYEDPPYNSAKASTEDVTATRDMAFAGSLLLGYNPMHANWDAWAGHWKMKCVKKPRSIKTEQIASRLFAAVERNVVTGMQQQNVDFTKMQGADDKGELKTFKNRLGVADVET